MRYPTDHKAATRRRVVEAAGRLFRARGYEATTIDDVMAEVGLTRGGFYAHFRTKADLFAAIYEGNSGLRAMLAARTGKTRPARAAEAADVIARYLDPRNRKLLSAICPMATLTSDVARAPQKTRKAYGDVIAGLARELANGKDLDASALVVATLAIGGLSLARAIADERLADALSRACASHAVRLLAPRGQSKAL